LRLAVQFYSHYNVAINSSSGEQYGRNDELSGNEAPDTGDKQ
jgi:hypothetical protein